MRGMSDYVFTMSQWIRHPDIHPALMVL